MRALSKDDIEKLDRLPSHLIVDSDLKIMDS